MKTRCNASERFEPILTLEVAEIPNSGKLWYALSRIPSIAKGSDIGLYTPVYMTTRFLGQDRGQNQRMNQL